MCVAIDLVYTFSRRADTTTDLLHYQSNVAIGPVYVLKINLQNNRFV